MISGFENRSPKLVVVGLLKNAVGEVLVSQRHESQPFPLQWEFPGGKVEWGESPQEALIRELQEEIGVRITIKSIYEVVFHRYPEFDVLMLVYLCHTPDIPHAIDVKQIRWVLPNQLLQLDILPADAPIIEKLIRNA